jgi:hypothetical protein
MGLFSKRKNKELEKELEKEIEKEFEKKIEDIYRRKIIKIADIPEDLEKIVSIYVCDDNDNIFEIETTNISSYLSINYGKGFYESNLHISFIPNKTINEIFNNGVRDFCVRDFIATDMNNSWYLIESYLVTPSSPSSISGNVSQEKTEKTEYSITVNIQKITKIDPLL